MSVLPKDFYMYYEELEESGAEILDASDSKTLYLEIPLLYKKSGVEVFAGDMTPKSVIIFTYHGNMFAMFKSTFSNILFKYGKWYIKPCIKENDVYVCQKSENFMIKNINDIKSFIKNTKNKLVESFQKKDTYFLMFENYISLEKENSLKNFLITFINEKFYISDNTILSFIKMLKKLDPTLLHDTTKWGRSKNSRSIIIRSSNLTQLQIKDLIKKFIDKYDWLTMDVVVTKYF